MSLPSRTRIALCSGFVALLPFAVVTTAQAAATGASCGAGYVKTLSKCIKKAAGTRAKCYKLTNADCADGSADLNSTYLKASLGIYAKCPTQEAINDSGYGTLNTEQLADFLKDQCEREAAFVTDRTFGATGANWTSGDDDEKKCLSTAAKEASKFLSGQVGGLGKCIADGCSFDFSTAEGEVVTKINDKCADFAAASGMTAAVFMDGVTPEILEAAKGPCDPMDTTRCMYPFPNDYFTRADATSSSGRRLAVNRFSVVANTNGIAASSWNEADGWSIGTPLLFQDTNIDLTQTGAVPITDLAKSLDTNAPAILIDAETGDQQLFWLERDQRGLTLADQPLIGRIARNLQEGRRYIVALRNMKNSGGTVLSAPAAFASYRDSTTTTQIPVEARRAHMEDVLDTLTSHGIDRASLYMAWDFTTQSTQSVAGKMLSIRDQAFAALGSAAPTFTVTSTTHPTMMDEPNIYRLVNGTFQVPRFLTGTGGPGSTLLKDANGNPTSSGSFTANFRCVIPRSANTAGALPVHPARIATYGHGLLGSYTEVDNGNVSAMANEHNFIFCATYWTGFCEQDEVFAGFVVSNYSNFPTFIDRQHQGILNQLFLQRLMKHPSGFASHASFKLSGQSMMDTSELFYDGNSQGGILGGVLAAFSQDAERFSLGVPGINYSTLLHRSVDFETFEDIFNNFYAQSLDRQLLLAYGQVIWDRIDPSGHINHVTADPYAGTSAKKLLYQVAFGDHQVAPVTAEIAARSNGAKIHTPVVSMSKVLPEVDPYYDIDPIPMYPYDGTALIIYDSGNPAPPIGNIFPPQISDDGTCENEPMVACDHESNPCPDFMGNPQDCIATDPQWDDLEACSQARDSDPHQCPRNDPDARVQKSEFLKTGGAVVDVCGGAACSAQ